jgi:hypothetical protein
MAYRARQRGAAIGQVLAEQVGAVGDNAVAPELDELDHPVRVVDRPDTDGQRMSQARQRVLRPERTCTAVSVDFGHGRLV